MSSASEMRRRFGPDARALDRAARVLGLACALILVACGDAAVPNADAAPPALDLSAGVDPDAHDLLAAFNPNPRVIPEGTPVLRACGDPNNLPYSNARLEGFENELIALVARELGRDTAWTWFPQRRGFARNTLRAGRCDVIAGIPSSYELALTTAPYYRSTYVFVTRADRGLDLRSLDDPRLRDLRIGLHVIGDDYSNTPGTDALLRRGIVDNVVGFSIYGDYSEAHPPARLIEAVTAGAVDVAIVWGPIAGFFARTQNAPLRLEPVTPQIDPPFTPFVYDVAMGVRRGDDSLRVALERILERRAPDVHDLLRRYGVPLLETGSRARNREAAP